MRGRGLGHLGFVFLDKRGPLRRCSDVCPSFMVSTLGARFWKPDVMPSCRWQTFLQDAARVAAHRADTNAFVGDSRLEPRRTTHSHICSWLRSGYLDIPHLGIAVAVAAPEVVESPALLAGRLCGRAATGATGGVLR